MPIQRNTSQQDITLEEFYQDLAEKSTNQYANVGHRMVSLIEMINSTFNSINLWGLTSHARLVIQSENDWGSKWYIIIASIGTEGYYFEYLLPEEKQPWKGAIVRGEAKSLEEAKKYLLIAMRECEGWKGNEELKRLLEENDL